MKKYSLYVFLFITLSGQTFATGQKKTENTKKNTVIEKGTEKHNYQSSCKKSNDKYKAEKYKKCDCTGDLEKVCANEVKAGLKDDVEACLWRNVEKLESNKCKKCVSKNMNKNNCLEDAKSFCKKEFETGCKKDVKTCLKKNEENLKNEKCKKSLEKKRSK